MVRVGTVLEETSFGLVIVKVGNDVYKFYEGCQKIEEIKKPVAEDYQEVTNSGRKMHIKETESFVKRWEKYFIKGYNLQYINNKCERIEGLKHKNLSKVAMYKQLENNF